MKKFLMGFLIGALLFSITPVTAAIEEYILYKADYKVMVNSVEYQDEDLPILDYKGSVYAPMRSMLEFAGLDVNYNAELKQTEIISNEVSITNDRSDNSMKIYIFDNVEYLRGRDIYDIYNNYNFGIGKLNGEKVLNFIDIDGNILIENVPYIINKGATYIEYQYYLNNILPLIK